MNWDKFIKKIKTPTAPGEKMQNVYRRTIKDNGEKILELDGKENIQEEIQGHLEECMLDGDKIAVNQSIFEASEDQFGKNIVMSEDIVIRQQHLEEDNRQRQEQIDALQKQLDELKATKQQEPAKEPAKDPAPAEPKKETT